MARCSLVAPVSRLATAASMAPVSMPPLCARFTPSAACRARPGRHPSAAWPSNTTQLCTLQHVFHMNDYCLYSTMAVSPMLPVC